MSRRLLIARPGHIYLATYTSASATITIDLDEPFPGNPSWFTVSPTDPHLLYTSDEGGSTTYVLRLDLEANTLTKVAQSEDGSNGVCHLAFNKEGTILIGTSWAEGTIDIWNTESSNPKLITTIQSKDAVIDAGRVARAHEAVLDPTGRFFIVNDLGTDSLLVLDALRPDVPVVRRVTVPSGSGPRHGVFYPAGEGKPATHYFLLCETTNRVEVFKLKYTEVDIEVTPTGGHSTFLDEEMGAFAAGGEIVLSKDGGHVYTSNRLMTTPTETISHFRVKPESDDGELELELELVGETSTQGKHPRMFSLSKNGNELFVGNQEGEWAVVVLRRRQDGTLEEKPVAGLLMEDIVIVKGEGDEMGPKFVLEVV
ncbi:Lactonase, 7-bladed beta-propeller domain-containing protein [Trichoderma compactum]